MIKGIMAIDENGGISKGTSMPWPKNSIDLKWFKNNTINNVVVIGRKTWEDPFMPTPLKNRINALVTNKNKSNFPGAHYYLSGNISDQVKELQNTYNDKDIFIIGGAEIINLTINIIQEFYLTRIYGNYECEKFLEIDLVQENMKMIKKIDGDKSCHFEIWTR